MRPAMVLPVLVLAGLPGCLTAEPVAPEMGGEPWSQVWDGPFAAMTYGYGFVAIDEEGYGPIVGVTAVDHAGHVLTFGIQYGPSPDQGKVEVDAASEPWRGPIEELLAPGILFPDDARNQYRASLAKGRTLSDEDWPGVRHALRDGIASAREPRAYEDRFVADGGSRLLFAQGDRVQLDDNHDDGAGWGDIEEQLELLNAWMANEGSGTGG